MTDPDIKNSAPAGSPNNHQFETNRKYYIISIYAMVVITICALVIKLIFSLEAVSSFIGKYFTALTPVVAGFSLPTC